MATSLTATTTPLKTPGTKVGDRPKVGSYTGTGPAGTGSATGPTSDLTGLVVKVTVENPDSNSYAADAGRLGLLLTIRVL